MKTKAKHGLWMFHLAARQVRERYGYRWWVDEELELIRRVVFGYDELPKWYAISRCAYRFMRLHKIQMTTGNYNELVLVISDRSRAHTSSTKAATAQGRTNTPIRPHKWNEYAVSSVRRRIEVVERLNRILAMQSARHQRVIELWRKGPIACDWCRKEQEVGFGKNNGFFPRRTNNMQTWIGSSINDGRPYPEELMLCVGCTNKARALERKFFEADAIRVLVNKHRKEIKNAAPQNNA